jgi:hypothetical protein
MTLINAGERDIVLFQVDWRPNDVPAEPFVRQIIRFCWPESRFHRAQLLDGHGDWQLGSPPLGDETEDCLFPVRNREH